jgi:F-type H+-transporting ATPase subunit b
MNAIALLADAVPGSQIQKIASTFGVDWPHLVAQVISFGIVCLLLHRFAYKPVLQVLDQRRQQIAQGVADREKIKAELEQAEAERRKIIVQAEAKATQVIEEAHSAAARVMEREMQKAVATAEQVIANSREAASREHDSMLGELKQEIGGLVVQATSAVTRKVLTFEDQKRMAEETVNQIGRAA